MFFSVGNLNLNLNLNSPSSQGEGLVVLALLSSLIFLSPVAVWFTPFPSKGTLYRQ